MLKTSLRSVTSVVSGIERFEIGLCNVVVGGPEKTFEHIKCLFQDLFRNPSVAQANKTMSAIGLTGLRSVSVVFVVLSLLPKTE